METDNICKAFFSSSMVTPATGPNANAPVSVGKSDRSIPANDEGSGTGNSRSPRIKEFAVSISGIANVRVLKIDIAFLDTAIETVFIILLVRYEWN